MAQNGPDKLVEKSREDLATVAVGHTGGGGRMHYAICILIQTRMHANPDTEA